MTPRWTRLALAGFTVLSLAFAANVFVLQPEPRTARLRAEASAAPGGETGAIVRRPGARGPGEGGPASAWSVQLAAHHAMPDETAPPRPAAGDDPELTRAVERELKARGYETGAVDGAADIVTRAAIMAFETDRGLPLTAAPSEALLRALLLGADPGRPVDAARAKEAGPAAVVVIRTVQEALRDLGYGPAAIDGRLSAETAAAIRKFEAAERLPMSGRISGPLVARLALVAGKAQAAERP